MGGSPDYIFNGWYRDLYEIYMLSFVADVHSGRHQLTSKVLHVEFVVPIKISNKKSRCAYMFLMYVSLLIIFCFGM